MADSAKQLLVRVPELELAESPSSWLSRTALAQGVTAKELLKYLDLAHKGDVDLAVCRTNLNRLAAVCGISNTRFRTVKRMFLGVSKLDRSGTRYLLSHSGTPRYRFCAACVHEQPVKHFPLHWRFKAWRWCPAHNCMLDAVCPHCEAMVLLPRSLETAGPNGEGVATLGRCLVCGKKLSAFHAEVRDLFDLDLLAPWEQPLLLNGRALLAALYLGSFRVSKDEGTFSVGAIRRIERQGLLPHDHFKLDSAEYLYASGHPILTGVTPSSTR
jgi:hypothetical protein